MVRIGDLLEKFAKLARSSDDAKSAVLTALHSQGIKITDINTISIKGSTAMVKLSALQKNEVFLKQKKILAELAKNPLTKHITLVR